MRLTITFWIAAVGLIVIGIGVRQVVVSRVDTTAPHKAPDSVKGPTVSIASGRKMAGDPRTIALHKPSAKVDQSTTGFAKSAMETTQTHDQGEPLTKNTDSSSSDPAEVIGRPFPVSATIEDDCKRRADAICKNVNDKLAKLAQEPRDPVWAPRMEALIEQDVLSVVPGKYQIRNIECRTSLCAVETESNPNIGNEYGAYWGDVGRFPKPLTAFLHTDDVTGGMEISASGSHLFVSVVTFTRR